MTKQDWLDLYNRCHVCQAELGIDEHPLGGWALRCGGCGWSMRIRMPAQQDKILKKSVDD